MKILVLVNRCNCINYVGDGNKSMCMNLIKSDSDNEYYLLMSDEGYEDSDLKDHKNLHIVSTREFYESRYYLKKLFELARSEISKGFYDLVQSHVTITGISHLAKLDDLDIPIIQTEHCLPVLGASYYHNKDNYRKILSTKNRYFVCLTNYHKNLMLNKYLGDPNFSDRIFVITNGLVIHEEIDCDHKDIDAILIGRLDDPMKNVQLSLKIALQCFDKSKIVVVGNITAESDIRANTDFTKNTLKLVEESGVTWYKSIPNYEVCKLLGRSKWLLNNSRLECCQLSTMESGCYGATNFMKYQPEIADLCDDSNSIFMNYPPRKMEKTLVNLNTELLKNSEPKDSKELIKISRDRFDIKKSCLPKYLELYNLALTKKDLSL